MWIVQLDVYCDEDRLNGLLSALAIDGVGGLRSVAFNHEEPLHANRYDIYADDVLHPSLDTPPAIERVVLAALDQANIEFRKVAWSPVH